MKNEILMKKRIQRIVHNVRTGGVVKTLSRSRLYRDACERYGLVYFGSVDARDDEHTMVRGLTVSAGHIDRHYCVGSVEGFEMIMLERSDQLHFPYKKPESYRWTIIQIDLDRVRLPHIFLDAHQHQSAFYDAFFAKHPQMRRGDVNLFADHDPRFASAFNAYCAPQDIAIVMQILHYDITAILGHHFAHYDFELFEDKLLVYSSNRQPTRTVIDDLFRAGVWFAREIEKLYHPMTTSFDEVEPQR